jgi:hypothetical protein
MAVATLLRGCHLRVAKLVKLTMDQIKVPKSQGVAHWRLLLSPKEVDEGERLKAPEVYSLVPIWWEMQTMAPDALIVGRTYLELLAAFRSTTALVPSQARHNGARRQKERQQKGKWLAAKPARRREKSQLTLRLDSWEASLQEHFLEFQRSASNVSLVTGNETLEVE